MKVWSVENAIKLTFAWQLTPFLRGLLTAIYIFLYLSLFTKTTRRMRGEC